MELFYSFFFSFSKLLGSVDMLSCVASAYIWESILNILMMIRRGNVHLQYRSDPRPDP